MELFLHLPFASQNEFIIKNVTDILSTIIPSEAAYEQGRKKKKKKKKHISYKQMRNKALLQLTLCFIILAIQTMIPSPRAVKTFPGCKRSFNGFPYEGDGNNEFLTYIACIVSNIAVKGGDPWTALKWKKKRDETREDAKRHNILKLTNGLKDIFTKLIIPSKKKEIDERIRLKREFLSQQQEKGYIIEEYKITSWTTFLPPLHLIYITNLREPSTHFMTSLSRNIVDGDAEQFDKLSMLKGKIILYSLSIQQSIRRIINKSEPLLKNNIDEPFLENVCCNQMSKNTIEFFSTQAPSIQVHNRIVNNLSYIVKSKEALSNAAYLYDSQDTRLPPIILSNRFTENTIYKAFIRYCRFNSGQPLSTELQPICLDNTTAFLFTDSFEEKMRILKGEGKEYHQEELYQLLAIIEREKYCPY